MTEEVRKNMVDVLQKICGLVAVLGDLVESMDVTTSAQDISAPEPSPAPEKEAPAKVYTYEEARAILAEKSRTGFRAEVKAILTKHGVTQLSDVKDPKDLAAIVAAAERIGNG